MARAWRNLEAALVAGIDLWPLEQENQTSLSTNWERIRRIFANNENKYDITVHVEQAGVVEIRR